MTAKKRLGRKAALAALFRLPGPASQSDIAAALRGEGLVDQPRPAPLSAIDTAIESLLAYRDRPSVDDLQAALTAIARLIVEDLAPDTATRH